jgi:predicted regulator of Ras-like GTPase activity (Roadblock/LC7/MglB family)
MSDYAALAQRVASGVPGIRGCVLLSRDGMILGAHPEGDAESHVKAAWLRFSAVGDAERSYVEFPDQTWAYVRRGAYAGFVVADAGVRPGLLVDLLDQVLMAGEVERIHEREAMRAPEVPVAPARKPRTILHRAERSTPQLQHAAVPVDDVTVVEAVDAPDASGPAEPSPAIGSPGAPDPTALDEVPETPDGSADPEPAGPTTEPDDDAEVDRILLAKEFAGLLQVPRDDDEATR